MTHPPEYPKIYHIVHIDKLPSIIADGFLFSDEVISSRSSITGTTVGMQHIKQRRLTNTLASYPSLTVGQCVPFYFCPRSVMLFLLHQGNHPQLTYRGGQGPLLHLEADLHQAVAWAQETGKRWAFTTQNAGSYYFEDYADLVHLDKINWQAVAATDWRNHREAKQAEFLIETSFLWTLVSRIGVLNPETQQQVTQLLHGQTHRPLVEVKPDWYY